jgi:hypothetical protein
MTDQKQSKNVADERLFAPLINALRREAADARILELIEDLRARGHSTDVIVARVVQGVGASAGVRVQKVAQQRAQYMATGTWNRYKKSRRNRFRHWLRDLQDAVEHVLSRSRGAN